MAAYDEATRNYEQTVLTAFADVEKALTAITTCREQTERSRELVESNGPYRHDDAARSTAADCPTTWT